MKKLTILFIIISIVFLSCHKKLQMIAYNKNVIKKDSLKENQLKNWQTFDIQKDTVPGISLKRALDDLNYNKKAKQLIVAVLDTELDINHEMIKPFLWKNPKEIPTNGIDDDKNGYIDDFQGWNFLGNSKGESILISNKESSRILNYFKNNPLLTSRDSLLYDKASNNKNRNDINYQEELRLNNFYKKVFPSCYKTIRNFFPNGKYTTKQIDSLFVIYDKHEDKQLSDEIYFLYEINKRGIDSTWISNSIIAFEKDEKTIYNKDYNEKELTKDDPYNINDSIYGNNNIFKNAKVCWHSTQVTGLIASNLKYKSNNIKIIPVVMLAPKGEENNKDVAIAIRYAVNNGAQVINMSFGNSLSLKSNWVKDAILYAAKKDVLLIGAAGNSGKSIDEKPYHPIDYDEVTGEEFCNNLIKVGGSTHNINQKLVYYNSNYSKKNVDIFAPASNLYVPDATDGIALSEGTSLACAMVTSIAALIRSHYPKLTAAQVKQIILESGVSYDLDVQVPGEKAGTLKPFKELSKSGKVVNAYNALLLAEQRNKKKQ